MKTTIAFIAASPLILIGVAAAICVGALAVGWQFGALIFEWAAEE